MVAILLAIVCGVVPWGARAARAWYLALAAVASACVIAVGAATGEDIYPWTNIPVLVFGLTGGLLLGRLLPARAGPIALLLCVLGALDSIQLIVPGSPTGVAAGPHTALWSYGMFAIDLGGWQALGIFDILLVTAVAEHWRRRGGTPQLAVVAGVAGFTVALAVEGLFHPGGLPLVPFIALGWFASEAAFRLVRAGGNRKVIAAVRDVRL
jgi:hypothetical protein